jgi:hypothetical protein
MATVNQAFQSAPMGRRVVFTMMFAFAAIIAAAVTGLVVSFKVSHGRMAPSARITSLLTPFFGVIVLVPAFLYQRSKVAQFRIEENCLVLGRKRHPLEGLVGVDRDPEIMKGARKTWGNSGLGAITGRFRSKRVGKFEAFLTDPEKAVVLRWPDKSIAVSPADPEFFIYSVRSATGPK